MKLLEGDVEWETREWGSEYAEESAWVDASGFPLAYQDWSHENSRVVSGPYGPVGYSKFPGRRFPSRTLARQFWAVRATIIEEYRVPGRYIFRLKGKA